MSSTHSSSPSIPLPPQSLPLARDLPVPRANFCLSITQSSLFGCDCSVYMCTLQQSDCFFYATTCPLFHATNSTLCHWFKCVLLNYTWLCLTLLDDWALRVIDGRVSTKARAPSVGRTHKKVALALATATMICGRLSTVVVVVVLLFALVGGQLRVIAPRSKLVLLVTL